MLSGLVLELAAVHMEVVGDFDQELEDLFVLGLRLVAVLVEVVGRKEAVGDFGQALGDLFVLVHQLVAVLVEVVEGLVLD